MIPNDRLASKKSFFDEGERRKRLGQYYSGNSLGRILAALAEVGKAASIVDPMSGTGDLLAACVELGANPSSMGAIDIDPVALECCRQRHPQTTCVLGSAFDPKSLGKLPRLQWDLVITNPPYVRYQSISQGSGMGFLLPTAIEIRNGLISEIGMLPSLDETDKNLFQKIAQGYSGLADLAVPSWILCAGLVTLGGRIALVVPEAWLSREYATVIHYILLRWFEIEFVVEDEHAAWFSEAQVKTTLLVAKRVHRREGAFDFPNDKSFLKIAVSGKASGLRGPCSRLMQGKREPETSFAQEARNWLFSGKHYQDDMVRAFHVSLPRIASNLHGTCVKQKWFHYMGEVSEDVGPEVPHELEVWLDRSHSAPSPMLLSSLCVQIGQGLRTGANAFFYCEKAGDGKFVFEKLFSDVRWAIPNDFMLPVVRRQSDLSSGFLVSIDTTQGRILNIRKHALPEDICFGGDLAAAFYLAMPESLAELVRATGLANFGCNGQTKRIWDLSAVAPNVRQGSADKGMPPRFWYMLPKFARRHKPDLLMARINNGSPKAYLNKGAKCIIDANFITFWIEDSSKMNKYALLALLNSAWTASVLENLATVMGGGALKVEAAHLRRLPIPSMKVDVISGLAILGKRLLSAKNEKTILEVLKNIDILVSSAALGREASDDDVKILRAMAESGKVKRKKHKNKGRSE